MIDTLAPLLPRATAKHNYPANPEDFEGVCVCVCVCVPARAWAIAQSALHMSVVVRWLLKPKKTESIDGWPRCG